MGFTFLMKWIDVKLNKVLSNTEHKKTAWSKDVTSETILKCFSAAGFKKKMFKTYVKVPEVQICTM